MKYHTLDEIKEIMWAAAKESLGLTEAYRAELYPTDAEALIEWFYFFRPEGQE